jgi:hypothetical protein
MAKLEAQKHHFVDPRAAAEYCGVSANTLKRWRYEGTGPRYYKPGRVLYDIADLNEFIQGTMHVPRLSRSPEAMPKKK